MSVVSVIVVTYNSSRVVGRCLASVHAALAGLPYEIIVVDNASADDTALVARSARPDCTLVANTANVGFAAANNIGIGASTGDILAFLNPDTIAAPGSVATLAGYLERHAGVGLVGPKLIYPDGRLQHSVRNFPSVTNQAFEAVFLHKVAVDASGRFGEVVADPDQYTFAHDVDWVSGAAMVARRVAIEGAGGFDERYFLYAEELDLCRTLRSNGWGVEYVPDAVIVHEHGDTTAPELFRLSVESRLAYYDKHFSGPARLAIRAVSAVGLATRTAVWAVRRACGNRSALAGLRNSVEGLRIVMSAPKPNGGARQ